jgi:hypothetical protein
VVDYLWRGKTSKVLYRFATGTGAADAIADINALNALIKGQACNNWGVPGSAVWYPEGVHFGTEESLTTIANGTGGSDIASYPEALRTELLGRTSGGRRVAYYLAGMSLALTPAQRVLASAEGAVSALVSYFTSAIVDGSLRAIDGLQPTLKPYVNQVVNDYLTRQARAG